MIHFNIKQTLRHLVRRKYYTAINLLGLGIGLGCVILMTTYLIHEFSFDTYHKNASNIYRLIDGNYCKTYYAMGNAFRENIPEIDDVCRLHDIGNIKVKKGIQFIEEDKILFADASLFNLFDIKLLNGQKENQLNGPNSVIISEKISKKYFPESNPVGQNIELAIGRRIMNMQVSGVFEDFPSYSSIQSDFIGNIDNAFSLLWDLTYTVGMSDAKVEKDYRQTWERNEFNTFIMLNPNSDVAMVEEKMAEIALQHREENPAEGIHLQQLSKMYLHSGELNGNFSLQTNQLASLKIFMGIAFLILLVAIINFILISNSDNNLSINEIACRKVNGASRRQILFDSVLKTVSVAFISLMPSLLFVWIMLPVFNNLFEKELSINLFMQLPYISALIVITIITGISAGLYLGMYISSINPASLFQKRILQRSKQPLLKGSLVIVQFIVFILLTSSFMLMYKQYNYSLKKDLGLNISNLVAININNDEMMNKADYLTNQIRTNPNVIDCRPTSFTIPPSENFLNFSYRDPETGKSNEQEALVFGAGIIEMLGIQVIEGRSFNDTDKGFAEKFIINEAAAKKYNVKAGDKIGPFDVIGIVNNFHFHTLHRPVEPVFIALQSRNYPYLLVKTNGNNTEVINFIKDICNTVSPGYYMDYEEMEDRNANFYKKEEKQMGTIAFFSVIALIVSTMGLIGFVSLNLIKRTKEIGIRKINGATIAGLVRTSNRQYLQWILIAFTIATPVAYFGVSKWLENFAYKTTLSWWVFALAGLLALGMALFTVSLQSWKAATKNPVDALRYE